MKHSRLEREDRQYKGTEGGVTLAAECRVKGHPFVHGLASQFLCMISKPPQVTLISRAQNLLTNASPSISPLLSPGINFVVPL